MSELLSQLIQSKVKRKLLKLFLFNTNNKYHTRELSRLVEEPISAVQRELKKLHAAQIIHKSPEGHLVRYFANSQNPFFKELKSLVLKATTQPKDVFKLLLKTKSLETVAIYGDTVKSPMNYSLPIDLLVVGTLDEGVLNEYLKATMELFGRDYNLLYMTPSAYQTAKSEHKTVKSILKNSRSSMVLKGSLDA